MATRYRGSEQELRSLDTFLKLKRATESLGALLGRGLATEGLTPGQIAVLDALWHLGAMTPTELSRKLLRGNPNITTVLDNLERAGLVRRERQRDDRRGVLVELTAGGRDRVARAFPAHARRITALLASLTGREQRVLGRLCKKLGLSVNGRLSEGANARV